MKYVFVFRGDYYDLPTRIRWFKERGWKYFPFQRETWAAYLAGDSGLVSAPTGFGKTYSVWGGAVQEWLQKHQENLSHMSD